MTKNSKRCNLLWKNVWLSKRKFQEFKEEKRGTQEPSHYTTLRDNQISHKNSSVIWYREDKTYFLNTSILFLWETLGHWWATIIECWPISHLSQRGNSEGGGTAFDYYRGNVFNQFYKKKSRCTQTKPCNIYQKERPACKTHSHDNEELMQKTLHVIPFFSL